jgi:hypothetical protein
MALRCLLYTEDKGARLLSEVAKCQKDFNLDVTFKTVKTARNFQLT